MNIAAEISAALADEWMPVVYKEKVRSHRTRAHSIEIPKRENKPEIQYTLLGIELKVGRRRFACPDLATARYLRVFARVGCRDFAVPYDITQISGVADQLETSWQRALLMLEKRFAGEVSTSARSSLVKAMRDEINKIGPGRAMPLFDRSTKQRKA